jgi:hypothetical protein
LEEQRNSYAKQVLTQPRKDKLDSLLGMGWWNKEEYNKAQISKKENIIKEFDAEVVKKEESLSFSPQKKTGLEEEIAADNLLDLANSFRQKPETIQKKTEKKHPHKVRERDAENFHIAIVTI